MFSINDNDKLFRLSALKQICQSSKYLAYIDIDKYDLITLQDLINRSNNMSMLEMPIYLSKYAVKCGVSMLESYFPKIRNYIKSENISVVIEPDEKMYIMEHGSTKALNNIFFIVSKNLVLGALSTSITDIKEKIFKDAMEQQQQQNTETRRATSDTNVRENYEFPKTDSCNSNSEYTNVLSPDLVITTAKSTDDDAIVTQEKSTTKRPASTTLSIVETAAAAAADDDDEPVAKRSRCNEEEEEQQQQQQQNEMPPSSSSSLSTISHYSTPKEEGDDNDDVLSDKSSCFTSVSQRPVNENHHTVSSPPPLEIDTSITVVNKKFSDKDFLSLLGSLSPPHQQQQQPKEREYDSVPKEQKNNNGIDELLNSIDFN